jgi:hypothetical protein
MLIEFGILIVVIIASAYNISVKLDALIDAVKEKR